MQNQRRIHLRRQFGGNRQSKSGAGRCGLAAAEALADRCHFSRAQNGSAIDDADNAGRFKPDVNRLIVISMDQRIFDKIANGYGKSILADGVSEFGVLIAPVANSSGQAGGTLEIIDHQFENAGKIDRFVRRSDPGFRTGQLHELFDKPDQFLKR